MHKEKSPNYQQNYERMNSALWIESRSHEEKERAWRVSKKIGVWTKLSGFKWKQSSRLGIHRSLPPLWLPCTHDISTKQFTVAITMGNVLFILYALHNYRVILVLFILFYLRLASKKQNHPRIRERINESQELRKRIYFKKVCTVRPSLCHGQQLWLESGADQYLIKHTKCREQKAQILYFQKL